MFGADILILNTIVIVANTFIVLIVGSKFLKVIDDA